LSQAITELAADSALRERLGRAARTRAEQFDERVVLEDFAQLIDRLATRD
jgi:glycosyltransferase involved in cell wall biosynthesis